MFLLGLILISLSGIAEAVMDKLQFHYNKSIFNDEYFNQSFWNPSLSWTNKWKSDLKTEKFIGSSSLFVFTTDAWHLFKFFRNLFLFIGLPLICYEMTNILLICVISRVLFGIFFTLFFNIVLKQNKHI